MVGELRQIRPAHYRKVIAWATQKRGQSYGAMCPCDLQDCPTTISRGCSCLYLPPTREINVFLGKNERWKYKIVPTDQSVDLICSITRVDHPRMCRRGEIILKRTYMIARNLTCFARCEMSTAMSMAELPTPTTTTLLSSNIFGSRYSCVCMMMPSKSFIPGKSGIFLLPWWPVHSITLQTKVNTCDPMNYFVLPNQFFIQYWDLPQMYQVFKALCRVSIFVTEAQISDLL